MRNTIEALVDLQDRDRKMLKYMREARDIPARQATLEEKLAEFKDGLANSEVRQKENLAAQKTLELELDSVKGQIAKYKTQQLNVKNNDEFRAFENQIVMCRKEIEKLENREVELFEEAEKIKAAIVSFSEKLNSAKDRVEAEKEALERRLATTTEDIKRMQEKRIKMIEDIDKNALRVYTRIMNNKKDYAVVSVERDTCGGCHMKLTPQTIHDARSCQKLVTCGYCGRILYWDSFAQS